MDQANQNVTDDQELAKVLESMNQQSGGSAAPADGASTDPGTTDGLAFEETSTTDTPVVDPAPVASEPVSDPTVESLPATSGPVLESTPELDSLKKDALEELRPLVDKLNLPPDEKFDTLLLLIRSTDDKTLLASAHEAAKSITDETRRAQALLDVIKEIDYFSGHGANPAQ